MAVPRNRLSNARKNSKRAHHAKKKKNLSACTNCGTLHLTHFACQSCGIYAGRVVTSKES